MVRLLLSSLFLFAGFLLVPSAHAQATSALAGSWAGRWSGGNEGGAVSLQVSPRGVLSGTVTNDQAHLTGTVRAVVRSNGAFTGTVTYPGNPTTSITGLFVRAAGTSTQLTGTFTQRLGSRTFFGSFGVTAQRPYVLAGSWSGPWTSGSGNRGTVTLTIAADGSASGTVRNLSLRLNGTIVMQLNRRGQFTGTVQYTNGSQVNVAGSLRKDPNSNRLASGGFTEVDDDFPGGTFSLTKQAR